LVYLAGGVLMGLISTISRLGKADCATPCQPIQCAFDCATCLNFQFSIRITWNGIQNTVNCNGCIDHNTTLHRGIIVPFGPETDCSFGQTLTTDIGSCGIGSAQINITQNLISVTLLSALWSALWRLSGPNVIEPLCGGGAVVLPFISEGGTFADLCAVAPGSTVLVEVIPVGGGGGGAALATHDAVLTPVQIEPAGCTTVCEALNAPFLFPGTTLDPSRAQTFSTDLPQTCATNELFSLHWTIEPVTSDAPGITAELRRITIEATGQREYSIGHYGWSGDPTPFYAGGRVDLSLLAQHYDPYSFGQGSCRLLSSYITLESFPL
jgi:hypothetical protein